MKKNKYRKKTKRTTSRVFYKDIYKHKYRLVFSNIRHTTIRNYNGSDPDPKQLTRIRKITEIIKMFKANELDTIFTDYLRLFKIPYNNTMYYVVPNDCPVRKFTWAVNKHKSLIDNNKVEIIDDKQRTQKTKNNSINKKHSLSKENPEKKSKVANNKKLVNPKSPDFSTSINQEMELIEIPSKNVNESINNTNPNFTFGDLVPSSESINVTIKKRNQSLTRQLKGFYENSCQICNNQLDIGDDEFYSEVHHIQPLGKHNGPDIIENMIVLCPNHHIMFDKGSITVDLNTCKVFHVNKKHEINGKSINLQHKIDPQYIKYYNLNIFKDKITKHHTDFIVDFEDTVIFLDGEQSTEVTLENYYNRSLMNNMQRMLLYKKVGERFLFNDNYYQVTEIRKASK